jgi:hypothetical protein
MSMTHVYQHQAYVASISKQHKAADTYQSSLPWLLLLADGRIRRHASASEARDEAQKQFPNAVFKRA